MSAEVTQNIDQVIVIPDHFQAKWDMNVIYLQWTLIPMQLIIKMDQYKQLRQEQFRQTDSKVCWFTAKIFSRKDDHTTRFQYTFVYHYSDRNF